MITTKRWSKPASGFTFIEIMGAILVLTVAMLGASAYRYYAALDTRKAHLQTTAARISSLLLETWHGTSDPNTFDPTAHFGSELTIESMTIQEGPHTPTDFEVLGTYRIIVNGVDYRTALFWKDVYSGLRTLTVIVVWEWDPVNHPLDPSKYANQSFRLTTYVVN